jgi:uncharacterized protein YjbI with pentapeptide repeats/endonuclease YncB( thermonuclease family)
MRGRKALLVLGAVVAVVVAAAMAVGIVFDWPLPRVVALGAFICLLALGLGLWLEWPTDSRWSAFGQAIFGSALLAAAVWAISEFQRAQDERQSLRVTVGLQKDLSGADLSGKDLSDVQLAGKILAGADLTDADLEETSLVGANLRAADLDGADLSGSDLGKANLEGASLVKSELDGAGLFRANLNDADLKAATLTDASMVATRLRNACLARADLTGARLPGAVLYGAQLAGADVSGATFEVDYRGAFLEHDRGRDGAYLPSAGLYRITEDGHTEWPHDPQAGSSQSSDRPPPEEGSPRHPTRHRRVEQVSDGDTVLLGDRPAQLLGVDAPPSDSTRGGDAQDFVRRQLKGETVTVELVRARRRGERGFDRDRFGRLWVFIWRRGRLFNQLEIARGYAEAFPEGGRDMPRDLPYEERLLKAEEAARDEGLQIWEGCPRRALRPG